MIPSSAALNRKLAEKKLEMPVLAIGAELSFDKYALGCSGDGAGTSRGQIAAPGD
jgi:hypothetical protein